MATEFYVSADRPDDTGDGLSWATAKQTFTGVFSLITGLITDVTTIHVKAGTTNPYTQDATLRRSLCVGESSLLRIVCEVFSENNDDSTDGSPFNPSDGVGTWNPKETHTTSSRWRHPGKRRRGAFVKRVTNRQRATVMSRLFLRFEGKNR
ncbi:hypothetical protein K8I61_01025 [bacterium]|nr:hypothetical protein [bacterium]